jgi:lambda repressor-like predicted transcriptional regulator
VKSNPRKTLAANIRREAKRVGVGLNCLADVAGVSRSQLFDVLGANKGTTVDFIDHVAEVLDVAPHKLLRKRGAA